MANSQKSPSHTDKLAKQERKQEGKVQMEWLRPYQFQPGQSGNPKGRPPGKRIPTISDAMVWVMQLPYPPHLRKQLEAKLGGPPPNPPFKLPYNMTFAQACALGRGLMAVVDNAAAELIMDRMEGAIRQELELMGPGGAELPAPILVTQLVEITKAGETVKVIDIDSTPEPVQPPADNSAGN